MSTDENTDFDWEPPEGCRDGIRPLGAVVCFFRNHRVEIVWRDGAAIAWQCERCHACGAKLWMTGAWFVWWLRRGRRLGF